VAPRLTFLRLLLVVACTASTLAAAPLPDWLARHHDSVPLVEDGPGGLFADVRINGCQVRLQVDTGASDLFLSERCARGIGLPFQSGAPAHGIGGSSACGSARIDTLAVGKAQPLTHLDAGVLALDQVHEAGREDKRITPDGLLGFPALARLGAIVDFHGPTLWLPRGRAAAVPRERVVSVPLESGPNGLPLVQADGGGRPLRLIDDTGSERTVVTPAAAKRMGLVTRPLGTQAIGAGARRMTVRRSDIPVLRLPQVAIHGLELLVLELGSSFTHSGAPVDGILGLDVLDQLNASLDCAGRRLLLPSE
jgi:predicted aspartyl protease